MLTQLGGMTNITMPIFFKTGLSNAEILRFFDFPNGCLHRLLFLKSPIFWLTVSRGSRLISMSIFDKIGQSYAEILTFYNFSKWQATLSWIFKFVKFHWQTVSGRPRLIIVLNVVKNWSSAGRHCNFSNFQNGRRRHLGFLKSRNFIDYWGPEGGDASACQILSKSVNRLQRY